MTASLDTNFIPDPHKQGKFASYFLLKGDDVNGNVVHIEQNVPPCKSALETVTCTRVNPGENSLYVLEVTAGFVDEFNITKNSVLEIISI